MTLQEPIMAVDEGLIMLPVCVDFVGPILNTQAIVSLTTITGGAVGMLSLNHNLEHVTIIVILVGLIQRA